MSSSSSSAIVVGACRSVASLSTLEYSARVEGEEADDCTKEAPNEGELLSKPSAGSAVVESALSGLLTGSRRRSAIAAAEHYAQGCLGCTAAAPLCSAA